MTRNRVEHISDHTLYLGDCLEIMQEFEDGQFDAVVTDPPYGIGEAAGKNKSRGKLAVAQDFGNDDWDNQPASRESLAKLRAISRHQIVFGGNFFDLPPSPCWLVWDKQNGASDFADCELAWTNLAGAVRKIEYRWSGMLQHDMKNKEQREHPTQKPVPVIVWCLGHVAADRSVLDPFMGSGTTGVACQRFGRKFTGIEIEPKYFDIACRRIERECLQEKLPLEAY